MYVRDYVKIIFSAIQDDKLNKADRINLVKTSLEAIAKLEASPEVKGIYAEFKRKNPTLQEPDRSVSIFNYMENSQTMLTLAAQKGYVEIIQALLVAKANPDLSVSNARLTPLSYASKEGHIEVVQILLEAKVNPDLMDGMGNTALMWAAYSGHQEIVELLIHQGRAKLALINQYRRTALGDAINNKQLSTIYVLLSHGAEIKDYVELFKFLMEYDQRDPQVLGSLQFLCGQLKNRLEIKSEYRLIQLLNGAEQYSKKLNDLTKTHRKKSLEAIDAATESVFPIVLVDMITQYDAPLQNRIKLFKPEAIDELFPESKDNEAKNLVLKR